MSKNFIVGLYDDEEPLLKAVKVIREAGVKIHDAITPFPVHGLDHAMGVPETRLHTAGFIFGLCGFIFAIGSIVWITGSNWPINYGGKPNVAIPSYIPITFEFTVLCASVGMVITYFIRNGLSIWNPVEVVDERLTDDRFALIFDKDGMDDDDIKSLGEILSQTGAVEVKEKEMSSYKNLNG